MPPMSMEFLTQDYHKYFFGAQTAKYELAHCEDSLDFIPLWLHGG